MDDAGDEARRFHEGVRLFNAGRFFEAHEVWEDTWSLASGPRRRFYQGLIQCAVALEHVRRGNPRGVLSMFESARTKFAGLPETYLGVNHRQLVLAIDRLIAPVRSLPRSAIEPGKVRGMDLPVDLAQAPKIELTHDPFAERPD